MKLAEIFDLSGAEKNAENLKKNAKRQTDAAKIALARLRDLRAQKQLQSAKQDAATPNN